MTGERTAVPIAVLSGTAGTGKTSLAVQWAHEVKATSPDGQLFVNLAGYDPAGPAVDPANAATGFNTSGWISALLGDYEQARPDCERSLMLYRKQGNVFGEARALDSLGYIALHTGRFDDALNHCQDVLALDRELGNVYDEATALISLADTYLALGRADSAEHSLRLALDLYRAQNRFSEAVRVHHRIDALGSASALS